MDLPSFGGRISDFHLPYGRHPPPFGGQTLSAWRTSSTSIQRSDLTFIRLTWTRVSSSSHVRGQNSTLSFHLFCEHHLPPLRGRRSDLAFIRLCAQTRVSSSSYVRGRSTTLSFHLLCGRHLPPLGGRRSKVRPFFHLPLRAQGFHPSPTLEVEPQPSAFIHFTGVIRLHSEVRPHFHLLRPNKGFILLSHRRSDCNPQLISSLWTSSVSTRRSDLTFIHLCVDKGFILLLRRRSDYNPHLSSALWTPSASIQRSDYNPQLSFTLRTSSASTRRLDLTFICLVQTRVLSSSLIGG